MTETAKTKRIRCTFGDCAWEGRQIQRVAHRQRHHQQEIGSQCPCGCNLIQIEFVEVGN